MKSKAEIIDALQIHMLTPDCKGCAYLPDVADGRCKCCKEMIDDIITFLNKSDFEVMEEIFYKANKTICGEYTAANGHHVLEIHPRLDDDYRALIRFDEEGNIL